MKNFRFVLVWLQRRENPTRKKINSIFHDWNIVEKFFEFFTLLSPLSPPPSPSSSSGIRENRLKNFSPKKKHFSLRPISNHMKNLLNWFIFILYFSFFLSPFNLKPTISIFCRLLKVTANEGMRNSCQLLCIKCVNYGFFEYSTFLFLSDASLLETHSQTSTEEFFSFLVNEVKRLSILHREFILSSTSLSVYRFFSLSVDCLGGIKAWKAMQILRGKVLLIPASMRYFFFFFRIIMYWTSLQSLHEKFIRPNFIIHMHYKWSVLNILSLFLSHFVWCVSTFQPRCNENFLMDEWKKYSQNCSPFFTLSNHGVCRSYCAFWILCLPSRNLLEAFIITQSLQENAESDKNFNHLMLRGTEF